MRCAACNRTLSDFESTRKSATTGKYLDLCNRCFSTISDVVIAEERRDLATVDDDIDNFLPGEYE